MTIISGHRQQIVDRWAIKIRVINSLYHPFWLENGNGLQQQRAGGSDPETTTMSRVLVVGEGCQLDYSEAATKFSVTGGSTICPLLAFAIMRHAKRCLIPNCY